METRKENNLPIHIVAEEPKNPQESLLAKVDVLKRRLTANNHSATHLMHAALREVLGNHVEQKGSMVDSARLRFDFSHFAKMTDDEIRAVEKRVNAKIRENISCNVKENVPIDEATKMGAMALFGEKYGDRVRVITFDPGYSVELCGGTHVHATGQIGCFKIISESGIAAGVRRIEAYTADAAEAYINEQLDLMAEIKDQFKGAIKPLTAVKNLIQEQAALTKEVERLQKEKAGQLADELMKSARKIGQITFVVKKISLDSNQAKNLVHQLRSMDQQMIIVLAMENDGKANVVVGISDGLAASGKYNAGNIIRKISPFISGDGGGQPHFAMAGGKNPTGIENALKVAESEIKALS
jgi:alanyl-tRNA synthetase